MNVGHSKDHHFIEIESKKVLRGKESMEWVAKTFPRAGKSKPENKQPQGILTKRKPPTKTAKPKEIPRIEDSTRRKMVSFFPEIPKGSKHRNNDGDDIPRLVRKSTTPSRKLRRTDSEDQQLVVSNPQSAIQVYRPKLNPSLRHTTFESMHGTSSFSRSNNRNRKSMVAELLPNHITSDQIQQLRQMRDPRLFSYIRDDFQGLADGYGTMSVVGIRESHKGSMKDHFERAQKRTVKEVTSEHMELATKGKERMLKKIYDAMENESLQTDRKRKKGIKHVQKQLKIRDD